MRLTLTIDFKKHDSTAEKDLPTEIRQIGFEVTTTLESDQPVSSSLQEVYKLEQWVSDAYWTSTRANDNAEWVQGGWIKRAFVRDHFGKADDEGEWDSTRKTTTFWDEPGFLGTTGRHASALTRNSQLGHYEIRFKWKVFRKNGKIAWTSDVFKLEASPDNSDNIDYKFPDTFSIAMDIVD